MKSIQAGKQCAFFAAFCMLCALTFPAQGQVSSVQLSEGSGGEAKTEYSTATIKKVDPVKRRLLLSHGPIPNLGMSGMTMGFEVAAGVDITNLNTGDNIQFKADQIKGQYTVTEIRKP